MMQHLQATAHRIRQRSRLCAVLGAVLACLAGTAAARPLHVRFDNGIDATVYPPEYVLENLTQRRGDETVLVIDDEVQYRLITKVSDPLIGNKGDGSFHPMSVAAVLEALHSIRLQDAGLQLRVFVLPYPRRDQLDSSARQGMILLSPGVLEISDYAVHFTVAHEVGHLYQYQWMPDQDRRGWERYAALRGIQDRDVYNSGGVHKDRPHEIFAEDFRYLFGGEMATYSGGIENDDLPLPSQVGGLEPFLRDLSEPRRVAVPAVELMPIPNPFNPSTEVHVQFDQDPGPGRLRVRVVDARGREVRQLFDGTATSRQMRLPWDGKRTGGEPVASGVYFAALDFEGNNTSTKLLLVR